VITEGVDMSITDGLLDGSLIGRERLMQAREFYSPWRTTLPAETALARFTQRIAVQSELGSAREMAGLTDAQLSVLEGEFMRCQTRPRSAWVRHGLWVGALLVALACIAIAVGSAVGVDADVRRALTAVGLGLLLLGSGGLGIGGLVAFSGLHLDVSYGTAGLYVGVLDEQHPWLYKAAGLLHHEPAESYRQTVLQERGPLRGLDYVMMRELVAAHDMLERLRPARTVAEELQSHGKPTEASSAEPRLVQVSGASIAAAPGAGERGRSRNRAA
jgi:hypothetical protein